MQIFDLFDLSDAKKGKMRGSFKVIACSELAFLNLSAL